MKKLYEYIGVGELLVVKVAFVSLVLLVFIAAFTRYIGYPINWSVDMAQCLFAWCTFLAADIAMLSGYSDALSSGTPLQTVEQRWLADSLALAAKFKLLPRPMEVTS